MTLLTRELDHHKHLNEVHNKFLLLLYPMLVGFEHRIQLHLVSMVWLSIRSISSYNFIC